MKNNKVLSGKWSVRKDCEAFDIIDESGAFATCDNEAKAYLIASAPELLEACKYALTQEQCLRVRRVLREAISKAGGRA